MKRLLPFLLVLAFLAAACSGDDEPEGGTGADEAGALTVYAAPSLQGVLEELAPEAQLNLDASDELVAEVEEGAAFDAFAGADSDAMNMLRQNGLLEEATLFATNRLVLALPPGNPAGVEAATDLEGLDLVFGADLGYTRDTLEALGSDVAEEAAFAPDAVDQVAAGEADAGFVYYTDALVAGDAVETLELPAQALVQYLIAVSPLSEDVQAAEELVELLTSDEGRSALEDAGFGLP